MVKKFIPFILIICVVAGCSYSVHTNAYPYLKRIQLLAFENKSTEYALGEVVFNNLANSIREDGRLRMVTQQPDCQLEGSIVSYSEKVYSYDEANNVQDYLVTINFKVTFTDLVNNKVLYENQNLAILETYAVSQNSGSTSRFFSKEEAWNEICSKLFKTIMQNTLEMW